MHFLHTFLEDCCEEVVALKMALAIIFSTYFSFFFFFVAFVAKFVRLDLIETPMKARTAERECQSRGGHLASIHSQDENRTIKEMVGSGSMAWIGLKRRTVQNRPWVWTDDTEMDFGEWKPDVTDNENYVSISGDDGLWKAKTNDAKLPFVCKVIDNCP